VFFDAYKGIECIKFVNNLTGFACGQSFWKTTDAGNSWNEKTLPFSYYQYSICFLNENTGYTVGVNTIAKTTNGGDNWINQTPNINTYFISVSFINVNTGMVVGGYGTILRTTNGGMNWLNISRPAYNCLSNIQMLNADTVFCAGQVQDSTYRSLVIKSYTGGSTGINNNLSKTPTIYSLQQNYPNPFNPSTNIRYDLPKNGFVKLVIFDALGREVETLVNEKQTVGTYEAPFNASKYSSGIYFYRLITDNFSETKKMLLIK
jgi:hypothetical protein